MASEALDHDLRDVSAFLRRFDAVYGAVNDAVAARSLINAESLMAAFYNEHFEL